MTDDTSPWVDALAPESDRDITQQIDRAIEREIDREIAARIAACDLAEAWVERLGARAGFVVWRDDELTRGARERFDRASDIIERELRFFLEARPFDEAAALQSLIDALAKYAPPAVIRDVAEDLARP